MTFIFDTCHTDAVRIPRGDKFIDKEVFFDAGREFRVFGMIISEQRHADFVGDRLFPEAFHFGQIRSGTRTSTGVRTKNDTIVGLDDVAFGEMSNGRQTFLIHRRLISVD